VNVPGLSAAAAGRHVRSDPNAGGVARPGLRPLGPPQPAGSGRGSVGSRAHRVGNGLPEPRAFRHFIANRKPRANGDPSAIHDRDAVAKSYPNTLAFAELRAIVRGADPSQNVRVDIGRRG
jgi:hypothetical protein